MNILLLLLLAASPATQEPVMDTLVELDPIVVVGQRVPERLSKSVNSVVAVPAKSLETAAVDDVIEYLTTHSASITTTAVSGVGYGLGSRGQGKLLIRGLGFAPNRGTLVLIDGRPDIAGLFGHPLPDTYLKGGLQSAELVKGAASTLYGSNAVAGVLNLSSFCRPDRRRYSEVELNAGKFGTYNLMARHSQRFGSTVAAGWVEYLESNNQRVNNEYVNRSGGFLVKREDLGGLDLFVSGRYSSFDFADPGPIYAPDRATGDIQRMGVTFGLDHRSGLLQFSARAYSSYGEHTFSDGFNSVDRNNGIDVFTRVGTDLGTARVYWSGGLSYNYLGGSARNGTAFIRGGDFHEHEYAAHAQTQLRYGRWLDLTAGGRLVEHRRYGTHFVYQLGAVVSPGEAGSIKVSVATSYRNPTVSETQLFLTSNDSTLVPEDGVFYELGYFKRFGRTVSFEAALFKREGSNLIETVSNPSPPPALVYANTGSYDHWGIEATVRVVVGAFNLTPSYMHLNQDSYNVSVPEDKLALAAGWQQSRFRASLSAVGMFRIHADSAGTATVLRDFLVVNGNLGYQVTESLELKARIDNLFDADYELVPGYPMAGVRYRLGLALVI